MRLFSNPLHKQKGVAAVEFGILLTFILIPLIFGTTEYGRALYQYNALAKSTRNAARFLSQQAPGDQTNFTTAKCLATHGTPDCSGTVLAPELTAAMVTICDASICPSTHSGIPTGGGSVNLVTVTIGNPGVPYPFKSLVQFVVKDFNFGSISTTMRQIS